MENQKISELLKRFDKALVNQMAATRNAIEVCEEALEELGKIKAEMAADKYVDTFDRLIKALVEK